MKITLVKIILIVLFVTSFCFAEIAFIKNFSTKMFDMAEKIQSENSSETIKKMHTEMMRCLEENEVLLDILMSRTQQETILLSLGKMRDYLKEGKLFEVRVAAGEIITFLSDINTDLNIKK